MTDVIDRTELLQRPASETLPAMRALGMLPERTTDRVWVPDPADIQPSIGLLCQIDPLHPFTAGKVSQSAYNPQWFSTSGLPEVSIRSKSGGPNGAIYFNLSGLGAGRKCVAWVDLLVYLAVATTVVSGVDYFFGLRRRIEDARRERTGPESAV